MREEKIVDRTNYEPDDATATATARRYCLKNNSQLFEFLTNARPDYTYIKNRQKKKKIPGFRRAKRI